MNNYYVLYFIKYEYAIKNKHKKYKLNEIENNIFFPSKPIML